MKRKIIVTPRGVLTIALTALLILSASFVVEPGLGFWLQALAIVLCIAGLLLGWRALLAEEARSQSLKRRMKQQAALADDEIRGERAKRVVAELDAKKAEDARWEMLEFVMGIGAMNESAKAKQ